MLGRKLIRKFASSNEGPYGMRETLRKAWRAPQRLFKAAFEPAPAKHDPLINTTAEAFDGVSQEYQALIVNNTYDLQTFQAYEQVAQNNFGTVDNPHIIFTSDAPFRYVGCSGQPNEDDYEGHEFLVFMLREGPLQRCPACGQVYKLVRLRDEYSAEMDYYVSGMLPVDYYEIGEADHWSQNSIMKLMPGGYEHTQFEVDSAVSYHLVNPQDHDRILTDPAYRMEKLATAHNRTQAYIESMNAISYHNQELKPVDKVVKSKVEYETLIDTEIALRQLNRRFNKIRKFSLRQLVDIDNHERRERRMLERSRRRQVDNYTVFFGGLTEEEQRYRDYFETDLEAEPEVESFDRLVDEEVIKSLPEYRVEKFDFQEGYTSAALEDGTSQVEKLIFNFKYRRCIDSPADFERRQTRMVERQIARAQSVEVSIKF